MLETSSCAATVSVVAASNTIGRVPVGEKLPFTVIVPAATTQPFAVTTVQFESSSVTNEPFGSVMLPVGAVAKQVRMKPEP